MFSKRTIPGLIISMIAMAVAAWAAVAEITDIPLPPPNTTGGKPLMQVLKARQSSRAFSVRELSLQGLSDLLWAAGGINRSDSGKRTAPTAHNWQEIDIYVVLASGAYRYDPQPHSLKRIAHGDLRKLTGGQDFVATAPVNLVFVADLTKMSGASPEDQLFYAATDTGFISQNVYLFCASEGLATVVRGMVDREALAKALKLPPTSKIILAQTVGFPAEEEKK